ncbi:MAG: MBL fold metallo-hydrolase [Muribaculaceae bacterium]|nr:MBL fold metallo-hydrolase [Muribaculaceae bacterium]
MSETKKYAEVIFLGTGSAFPSRSYNACYAIRVGSLLWLTDGGGGNGIFPALAKADINPAELHHIFLSHAHTDHIFGLVWIIRKIVHLRMQGLYPDSIYIYANSEAAHALREICRLTFLESYYLTFLQVAEFRPANPGDSYQLKDLTIEFFDAGSENVSQSGFRMSLPDGKSIVALGDEALTTKNMMEVKGADTLICGAFCRYADRNVYKPYEKHHWTVKDVAEIASKIDVNMLILIHSEDQTPDKSLVYRAEAAEYFKGRVIIPNDGEIYRVE